MICTSSVFNKSKNFHYFTLKSIIHLKFLTPRNCLALSIFSWLIFLWLSITDYQLLFWLSITVLTINYWLSITLWQSITVFYCFIPLLSSHRYSTEFGNQLEICLKGGLLKLKAENNSIWISFQSKEGAFVVRDSSQQGLLTLSMYSQAKGWVALNC